jgi:hypothetical protein
MSIAGRADRTKFRNQILRPPLRAELLRMTIPEKPNSRLQKYHLTQKGRHAGMHMACRITVQVDYAGPLLLKPRPTKAGKERGFEICGCEEMSASGASNRMDAAAGI